MQLGIEIALWIDAPRWLLELALDGTCGHWELVSAWLDISFVLICY
jgi:hypothetical protein